MKWMNEYFFGEEVHWSDYAWFFGPLLFGILVVVYIFAKLH